MTIWEVADSSALLETHQILSKIKSGICTQIFEIYTKNSFIAPQMSNLWPLFSEAAFSTVYSWRTKYNSNWQSFWKYYWGGRLKEPKSLFLYGVFHAKHKHWGVLTELLCPPAVYAYGIGQLHSFGWNSTLDRKFLTYWGVWTALVNENETI